MSAPPPAITIDVNPRTGRFWDRIRQRVAPARPPAEASGAADLLLLLPDLTVLTARLLQDSRVPLAQKAVAVAGLAYVLSPIDLVPALFFGPLGLLDDLMIVAACLSGIVNRVHPDVVRSHWSGQGDALEAIERVTAWVEGQVVGGIQALWRGLRAR
ncbi:MAG: YkvA family protein [Myxococcota bacterium]|nr:YkvA family protein [Myxococcota bacterium]